MSRCRSDLPRAGIDSIAAATPAMRIVRRFLSGHPPGPQTLALLLDARRRGLGVFVAEGTRRPDDVVDVVRWIAQAKQSHDRLGAVVLATVRPDAAPPGITADDVDRWIDLDELLAAADVALVEWFVIDGRGRVSCPRDLLGAPARW